ncbi:hypothetical protein FQN57_002802 [Myotisia sp. PD_48]|nr:hypothetical protein FQN57_002802 [Myotisia sp. PD_48]
MTYQDARPAPYERDWEEWNHHNTQNNQNNAAVGYPPKPRSHKSYVISESHRPRARNTGSVRSSHHNNYDHPLEPDYESSVYRTSTYAPRAESEYQLANRGDVVEDRTLVHRSRDPREDDYWYERRVREYDNATSRRPEYEERYYYPEETAYSRTSRSRSSSRSRRRHRRAYSSDNETLSSFWRGRSSMDGGHRRHLAEGALVGVGAAELIRHRSKKSGEHSPPGTLSRVGRDVGAGAVGAFAANALSRARSRHRSKSRHSERSRHHHHQRAGSLDRGTDIERYRYRHRHRHGHSHSTRRRSSSSSSNSRVKTLAGLGLGAAAIAGAVALARKHSDKGKEPSSKRDKSRERKSRSRHRHGSSSSGSSSKEDHSKHRNNKVAEAGLAGAAVAGIIEHARSKSRSRRGERTHSRTRQGIPIAAAGLGSAAIAHLIGKGKDKKRQESQEREQKHREKEERRQERHERRRERSRSRLAASSYPGIPHLIEYGDNPVYGRIPAADYHGLPESRYRLEDEPRRRRSRSRSQSRNRYYRQDSDAGSSSSDREDRRKHRHRHHSRSRSKDLATAGLAAAGAGIAGHEYAQRKERKKAEKEGRRGHGRDPYEEEFEQSMYSASPPGPPPMSQSSYYPPPNQQQYPPPPAPNPAPHHPNSQPYNPSGYPPPPGAPPAPHPTYSNFPAPPAPEPIGNPVYRGDENVTKPSSHQMSGAVKSNPNESSLALNPPSPEHANMLLPAQSDAPAVKSPAPSPTKTKIVQFDLPTPSEEGYETDDSNYVTDSDGEDGAHYDYASRNTFVPEHPTPHPSDQPSSWNKPRYGQFLNIPKQSDYASDSDTTIELPPRFDSHGRLLAEQSWY